MDDYNTASNFKNLIFQDIERNFYVYNNLLKHLYNLYKNNIISEKNYIDNIEKLDDINTEIDISKSRLLLENNSIDYLIKIQNDVKNIFSDLIQIINGCGFNSSNKILEYLVPCDYYNDYSREIKRKFLFLNNFFVIIRVNKKTITSFNNIKLKIFINKEMRMHIDDNNNIFLANKNMLFELNKAVCELEIDDILISLEGYFIEDPLNDIYKEQLFLDKYCNLVNSTLSIEIPNKFKLRYINQLSVRDFLVKSNETILTDLENTYLDTNIIENKLLSELLKNFIFKDNYEQRKMIINLLLSNDNYLLASALVDSLNNGLGLKLKDSDQIKNTIHYSLRKRLSLASTELEEKKSKLNPEIKLDYNTKLVLLNISDKIKSKVLEKIKEKPDIIWE